MDEQKKYEVIKGLADHPGSGKERAALILGCSLRHVNRMLAGYKASGKEYFVHGNKGRRPANTISDSARSAVIELYRKKYYDANFTHYTELLEKHEGIFLSVSAVSNILEAEFILSPKVTRAKQKQIKKQLKELKKAAKTQKEADALQTNLVAVEDAHSRRPRAAYFGELLQMDATPFQWIPGTVWHLHLAIDEDTYTQFAYACSQLGVGSESSSIPQAKGRVERLNQTLQFRLPIELRLKGIATMEEANEFLNSYIKEFNEIFSLPLNSIKSVFETQPLNEKINLTLAVLCERTVDTGHCLRHDNNYYKMLDKNGKQVHYRKGTKTMLIQAFDGNKYCCVNDTDIYTLESIPEHEARSKELDLDYKAPKPRKQYIPPMEHPWRRSAFGRFVKKQEHHRNDEEKQYA